MTESLQLSAFFAGITPERLYSAWMDSEQHAAFTGSPAQVEPQTGGSFTAWDGYIQGSNLELQPHSRIIQSWRTTEFPEQSPDSNLEVLFEEVEGGTRLTLIHSQIPAGKSEGYRQGWEDYYFQPMQAHFGGA